MPLPGPQTLAFESQADELFYGGAAGGGKTDLLLGLATRQHRRAIIFRREIEQLKGIVDRSIEIIGQAGRYNENKKRWKLNNGAVMEFGGVQREGDVRDYQGRPHDFKGFDELPNFTEFQYRFLTGWARTTRAGQRVRKVGAGNPPTDSDGEWVIRRWAPWLDGQHKNPARPGELRWFVMIEGQDREVENGDPFIVNGETMQPQSRTFIPARLADNPYLMAAGYAGTLQAMPEPLRSQMLYGDFTAGLKADPWQVIPTAWVILAQERWTVQRPTYQDRDAEMPIPLSALGVDVARGGDDKTVIAKRYGHWFAPLIKHSGADTPDGHKTAGLVLREVEDKATINIDVIGVGASPYDLLRQQQARVQGINFAEASKQRDKSGRLGFANVRAEAWWRMREALDPLTGDDIALPPDPELKSDLCAPRWNITARGVQVEAKEDIIKRIKRSPDCGDAVVLALFERGTGFWV